MFLPLYILWISHWSQSVVIWWFRETQWLTAVSRPVLGENRVIAVGHKILHWEITNAFMDKINNIKIMQISYQELVTFGSN